MIKQNQLPLYVYIYIYEVNIILLEIVLVYRVTHFATVIDIVINTVTQEQLMDEDMCISQTSNTLGKCMYPTILNQAIGK